MLTMSPEEIMEELQKMKDEDDAIKAQESTGSRTWQDDAINEPLDFL